MQIFKILITGLLFCCFGLICIMGNLIFIPIILLRLQHYAKFKYFSRFLVRYAWRFFIFLTDILGYEKSNAKILQNLGSCKEVIICNHPSLLDVVFFLAYVKNANCIVKATLQKNIFLFAAIKACGYIPNTENEECLNHAIKALENNESLIIFPEGTRTRDSIVLHKAASYIAVKAAVCVTPIFLDMNPRSLAKNQAWYKTPAQVIHYTFAQLPSIALKDFYPNKPAPVRARLLHAHLQELYNKEFKNG